VKLVLDTSAVSALMKGDPRVIERLKQVSKGDLSVPQPALAEIVYGIERLPKFKRKDALSALIGAIRDCELFGKGICRSEKSFQASRKSFSTKLSVSARPQ
jgi:hypothetical protein